MLKSQNFFSMRPSFRKNKGSREGLIAIFFSMLVGVSQCPEASSRSVTAMSEGPVSVRGEKLNTVGLSNESPVPLNITETYSDLYTLGPGDGLSLVFLDPELKAVGGGISILPDGTAILPLIGSVQLSGLTIGQATRWLISLYEKQVVRPQLILQLITQRPTKVTVVGEVLKPGLYELGAIPRVATAIRTAGGISSNADIRKVLLRRVVGQSGAQKQTFVDLSQVFLMGNQFQNPVLFDGDTIVVGRSSEPIPDEVIRIGRTNLAPGAISVTIIGEVKGAGTLSLPANTPLMEALFRAGGLVKWRANKNHIELIRFNDNGTTTRQVFSYKQDLNVSNGFNPPLRDRDTIIVNRSFYGETLDALRDIAVPLGIINNLGGLGGGWNNNNNNGGGFFNR